MIIYEKDSDIYISTVNIIFNTLKFCENNISTNDDDDVHNVNTIILKLSAPVTRLHKIPNFFMVKCVCFNNRIPQNVRKFHDLQKL